MIELSYSANTPWRVGEFSVIALRLRNGGSEIVEHVELSIDGGDLGGGLQPARCAGIGAAEERVCHVRGLRPEIAGRDLVVVRLVVSPAGGAELAYVGRFEITVQPARSDAAINVNIQAGENMVADFEGMIQVGREKGGTEAESPRQQWQPIALEPDPAGQADLAKFCPPAVLPATIGVHLAELREVAWKSNVLLPERAAVLSLVGESATTELVAGDRILLGRDHRLNHVALRILPRSQDADAKTRRVSAQQLQLAIRPRRCVLIDSSSLGTTINGQPALRAQEEYVRDGDILEVGGVLRLQTRLCTDDLGIVAVRIDRANNQRDLHYVLMPVYATIGAASENAVVLRDRGVPPFAVAIYAVRSASDDGIPEFRIYSLSDAAVVALDGRELAPSKEAVLSRGVVLSIGSARIKVS